MARSDDLVPLVTRQPPSGTGFRQGVVVSWDPDTAENVIDVGGSLMTNLPCLNTSEASLLAEGDVVGVMTFGATWAILGRFIYPGTAQAVSSIQSITNRIQAAEDIAVGMRNSTSYGDLTGVDVGPSVTIRIGSSGRALVFWAAEIGQITTVAGALKYSYKITPHVGVQVSGANTIAPSDWNALNYNLEFPAPASGDTEAVADFWAQAGTHHLFSGLNSGLTTFTLKYRHDGVLPSTDTMSRFNAREIAVFAL